MLGAVRYIKMNAEFDELTRFEKLLVVLVFFIVAISIIAFLVMFVAPLSHIEWEKGYQLKNASASFWSTRDGTNYSEPFANKTLRDNMTVNELLDLLCRYSDVALAECESRDIPFPLPKMRDQK
jgi:hypothetical protein